MGNKAKKDAADSQHTDFNKIPIGKPAYIGNFKVWRTKKIFGKGKDKLGIEQINISTLDDSWQVKIPATFDMFGILSMLFADYSRDNSDLREGQLATFFGNMFYVSCIGNGYFQRAVNICATLYANPTLLTEEDENHKSLMKDVNGLISDFLHWKEEYDRKMKENEPTEQDWKNDQTAEEMMETLNKDK